MRNQVYFFDTEYTYNVFGANEHLDVNLWRRTKKGKLKLVSYWSFGTGVFPFEEAIANARADRRIKKLRSLFGAEPL